MYAQVEKPKENKSISAANYVVQKKGYEKQAFGFVDNRPEMKVRKLHMNVKNECDVFQRILKKRKQNYPEVIQRALNRGPNIEGDFTDIPSGDLACTVNANHEIECPFDMKARFTVPRTNTGGKGEYRQYVKGYFNTDGADDTHYLIGTQKLLKSQWKEDGTTSGYGHHGVDMGDGNKYITKSNGDETYEGWDTPTSNIPSKGGRAIMKLDFKGELIDSKTERVLKTKYWHIDSYYDRPL